MLALAIGSDFIEKIIQRYSLEFVLTLLLVKILSHIINSKLYIFILYISKLTSSPLFTYLYSPIINHKVFNTIYELKTKSYLKYVKNSANRAYLDLVIESTLIRFLAKESFLTAISVKGLLLSTKSEFLNSLIKELEEARTEQTHVIRRLVHERKITSGFGSKYSAWTDMIYQCTIDRVKDLIPNDYNNYKSFIQFLYIINDMIKIYIDQVALTINVFNIPGIKESKPKKSQISNNGNGKRNSH